CRAVFVNFRDTAGFDRCFGRHYLEALLQRSFRLVGQFCLLSQNAGLPIYRNWVPGCLRRIGQVLAMMPEKRSLLKVLCRALPEVESGAKAPLTWIDL
ncbi:MAG: hypothetical protein GX589_09530, partial [Deltaproteobacteria bacterium]|nr:hypothetical protein [Deltaproteobacteria bacterium]